MVFKTWFSGLGISTLGPGFSHSQFPRPKPEIFLIFFRVFFFFFFRPKLPSSTDRVFFFFFFFLFSFRPFPAGCLGLIQEFFEKKKKRVLSFKFLGFLGDGFGVKEKKKVGTGGLCPTVTGTH